MAVFGLAYPDCLAAVRVFHDFVVAWGMGSRTMMMEHVPFHASGHPGAQHSHIGRLDDMVVVEYIITIGLVDGINQTSADFRKHAKFHIFVLHVESLVGDGILLSGHVVVQKIRINASARSLIRPVTLENRSLFRRIKQIGRHVDSAFPSLYNIRFTWLCAQCPGANRHCKCQK